jgi:hypothetical protein
MFTQKLLLIPAALGLFAFSLQTSHKRITSTNVPMAYAIDSKKIVIDSAEVDVNGNYRFSHLPKGTYTVCIKETGKTDIIINGLEHLGPGFNYHLWQLNRTTIVNNGGYETAHPFAMKADKTSVTRMAGGMGSSRPSVESKSIGDIGSDFEPGAPTTGGFSTAMTGTGNKGIKAGQITAGNWRDLDNWEKWQETNKEATVETYQKEWGFYTNNRYAARFLDANGKPVIGCKVQLFDKEGRIEWEAITDNLGNVELWNKLNEQTNYAGLNTLKTLIFAGENKYEFKISPFMGGVEEFKLPVKTNAEAVADIAFVVDATGSMGDEIQYLQSELLDVVTRVKKNNTCLKLNMGSVFYKDHGDEYVTMLSDFSEDIAKVANFIFDRSAGGGGDFPEAVDDAMEAAIEKLNWSDKAISKIMFLVLDAPPHESAANKLKMQKYTKIAAQKGIKIIPIVASGINQSTEFLMKYLAIATNGNYVYITDHSGIGNPHEKPTGVKENMQYLNDLMVDIITENTMWDGCKNQNTNPDINKKETVEILTDGQWTVQVYPNPAVDKIMIKSNELPTEIGIYDIHGTLVKKVDQISAEKNEILLGEISTGVYIVRCVKGENMVSCRILVMK